MKIYPFSQNNEGLLYETYEITIAVREDKSDKKLAIGIEQLSDKSNLNSFLIMDFCIFDRNLVHIKNNHLSI